MWRVRMLVGMLALALCCAGSVEGRPEHRPHQPRPPRAPRKPKPPTEPGQPTTPDPPDPGTNQLFEAAGTVPLPGLGLALAWSPDNSGIAVGGRFRDKTTRLRYDTRVVDVAHRTVVKSFACHYFWVVATAWEANPYLGDVIADGGGDHAVKLWDAEGPGSTKCDRGQLLPQDGGIKQLPQIGGWITALAFSPDGRWLAGASRDRMIRIWNLQPGPEQFRVVSMWYDRLAGNFLSVAWAPDGRGLVTGDRRGRVMVWDVDMARDRWDAATVADFAKTGYSGQTAWAQRNATVAIRTPRWTDEGHKVVWNVRWSPDGTQVAGVGTDGTLSIYDAASGDVNARSSAPRRTAFHGLDWSPDGSLLAVGAADRRIYLFDATSGDLVDVLEGHADLVTAVAWSRDGNTLASTAGGQLLSMALLETTVGPDMQVHLWHRR